MLVPNAPSKFLLFAMDYFLLTVCWNIEWTLQQLTAMQNSPNIDNNLQSCWPWDNFMVHTMNNLWDWAFFLSFSLFQPNMLFLSAFVACHHWFMDWSLHVDNFCRSDNCVFCKGASVFNLFKNMHLIILNKFIGILMFYILMNALL